MAYLRLPAGRQSMSTTWSWLPPAIAGGSRLLMLSGPRYAIAADPDGHDVA